MQGVIRGCANFHCVSTSTPANHGFLRTGPSHYLQFDDGTPYVAIGENIAWQIPGQNPYLSYNRWLNSLAGNLAPAGARVRGAPGNLVLTPSLGWGGIGEAEIIVDENGMASPAGADGVFLPERIGGNRQTPRLPS
ncbi:MAG: hypothetical protein J5I98_31965 [Phaeodactylibacter sp.]|nr:hypothetical protein [Phaeodactylibacter sp.]